jgi:hypothetical protein
MDRKGNGDLESYINGQIKTLSPEAYRELNRHIQHKINK